MNLGARFVLALVWLLHLLPMPVVHGLGRALGHLLHRLATSRRRIAARNIQLCLPGMSQAERSALVREHFAWLGRSLLERGILWHASADKLRSLIHVEGDVHLAERMRDEQGRAVMWLVPHFMALEVAAATVQLFQNVRGATLYQPQSNPVFDAAMRRGRERFGNSVLFSRHEGAKSLIRAIRQERMGFFNLPDMDFGLKDSAFVPFFGTPAATLLAPSRMAKLLGMVVQPVIAEMTPQGWRVRFGDPLENWPTDDAVVDALHMNQWIETEIRRDPAQYLWVHKRFKTRPEGQESVYEG
jgi:Kdo2-lipid IVA lauroyltransferase/acyltransferase